MSSLREGGAAMHREGGADVQMKIGVTLHSATRHLLPCSDSLLVLSWLPVCGAAVPTNIGGVACPSRVIDVPVGSDLSEPEFSKMDVTYRLSPGKYTITSQVQYSAGSNPTPVCYVGPSPDVVTIHLKVSTWAFKLATPGEWLGLQGLTLDGQGQAGVVSVNNGAFAANEVVFIGCPLGAVQVTGAATSVCVLTSTTVTRCGSSTQAAVLMQSPLRTTWANVSVNEALRLPCLFKPVV